MEGHTRTSSITRPYTAANAYHRPRPRPSLDHSSSAPCSVSQTTEKPARQAPVNQLGQAVNTAAEPLPSRPANHIQQHHSAPRLNQAPLLRPSHSSPDAQYRIYSPEEEEEVHTTTEVLLDDVERLARPALTSKFSFDNLTAMDTSNGGALKRMATR